MSKNSLITEFFQRRSEETITTLLLTDMISAVEKRLKKHDLEYDVSTRTGGETELVYRGHGLKVTATISIKVEKHEGQDRGRLGTDSTPA